MKRLSRPQKGRKFAGVAAGIGLYTNTDPTIIRIIFVALLLPGGLPGFLPYVLLWLIMPDESDIDKA
jgi:phage shock protein PspC (stress-responsive transcriptional regulator)